MQTCYMMGWLASRVGMNKALKNVVCSGCFPYEAPAQATGSESFTTGSESFTKGSESFTTDL